jgi:hypothetical protein
VRTMASQRDKPADLFALTARSRNCLSNDCAPASWTRILQVQKQKTAEGTTGRAGRTVRRPRVDGCIPFPWQKSESAQVCCDAADGVASELRESTFRRLQVQPIEQPSAEYFGGEAA